MRRASAILGLTGLLAGASASGQPVRVDSTPPRATLVCDGRVVGLTPAAVDPVTVRSCSLFAEGHENLTLDIQAIHGVVARFALRVIPTTRSQAPAAARACGHPDPRTGLLVPCFLEPIDADRPSPREPRCGRLNPETGLLVPCFSRPPPVPIARRLRPASHGAPCTPRLSPQGLLVPCFDSPARRRAPPALLAPPCGTTDPRTGLLRPCF